MWTRLAVLLVVSLVWVGVAGAQTPPETQLPVPLDDTSVPYPEGALGDAVVVLEWVVQDDGRVSNVTVIEGVEPFAAQAARAARSWRFVPARRGGSAVAARVRAQVAFDAPEAVDSSGVEVPLKTPEPAVPREPVEPMEVVVTGERREIGQTTISAVEVREMPGAFGDPFRALETFPGVTPTMSGVPYFFVRGAPPNNNGYFLDGVRVPALFHIGLGPGVIHPGLIERIEFHPGAAPARYGGAAGAIISGYTRPPAERAHGEVGLRLVDAGGLFESPFASGRGSALVAGRYGYPGPVLSALSDVRLAYWDYQTRATWQLGAQDSVGLLVFGSHDRMGYVDDEGVEVEALVSDFHRLDLRYDRAWADGRLRVAGTLGYDLQGSNPIYLSNHSAAFRLELEQDASPGLRLRTGVDARLDRYAVRREVPADPIRPSVPTSVDPPPRKVVPSLYADLVWRIAPRVEVVPGWRVSVFDSARSGRARKTTPAMEPRLATRVSLGRAVAWLSTLGVSHQLPVLRVGDLPVVVAGGAGFPDGVSQLQRTVAHSQGIEFALPAEVVLGATAFASHFSGLTDLTASCRQIEPPTAPVGPDPMPPRPFFCPNNAPVSGHAHGIELSARRSLAKRVGGMLSYTLSRSVRETRFLTLSGVARAASVPGEFDRTHVLNAVAAYNLGRRWRAGTRLVLYSGVPYSRLEGSVPVPPYNSLRDPWFFRADVRLEKRWRLGERGFFAFVFEVQNATLSKEANALGMDCEADITGATETTRCERGTTGPLTLPSVGVEAVF